MQPAPRALAPTRWQCASLLLLLFLLLPVLAVHPPRREDAGETARTVTVPLRRVFRERKVPRRRALGAVAPYNGGDLVNGRAPDLSETRNGQYLIDIVLGGQEYTVQLDTGSADLWVRKRSATALTYVTDATLGIEYVGAGVAGTIAYADVVLAGYAITDQAFLNADETRNLPLDGILGLAPARGSDIYTARNNAFTLGTLDPHPSSSSSSAAAAALPPVPRLPLTPRGTPFWRVALDALVVRGGVRVDLAGDEEEKGAARRRGRTAIVDSGTSMGYVSPEAAEAMYAGVEGARRCVDADAGSGSGRGRGRGRGRQAWFVPCDVAVGVGFVFGGQTIEVHPLDMSYVLPYDDGQGTVGSVCVGTFFGDAAEAEGGFALGDVFLRNAYTIFDMGNATHAETVRFVPKTDPERARAEFARARARGGNDAVPRALRPEGIDCAQRGRTALRGLVWTRVGRLTGGFDIGVRSNAVAQQQTDT
ncbi:aspartic peptidase domain-containing protein [Amylostereum chailletii]|nr:aspartic peptidase domain-containing protein [Amylostereum chailletii]